KSSYPIASFTFLLVPRVIGDATKGKKLVDFIRWALHEGERSATALDYAPLPAKMVAALDRRLGNIKMLASK
ncbi:MAG: phosphate ABC transporter substrate-binding protein PstS, partial [Gemmatimonadaceae bacterium]